MLTVGGFLFKYRGRIPVPFGVLALLLSNPTLSSLYSGTLLILGGELLRIWSAAHAGPSTRSKKMRAETLITSGPYAHLRNPLYLGNFIITLGFLISANSWMPYMLIPFAALFSLQYGFIVNAEEKFLIGRFGARYLSYANEVPAFLPRLRSYSDQTSNSPDLRRALRSESGTLVTIVGLYLLIISIWLLRRFLGA